MATRYIYNLQIQDYSVADGELKQDAHTLNCWADKGWELTAVAGPVTCGDRGMAFIYYFRKPLVEGQPNPILENMDSMLRGENCDQPE
jgi:hypothetical protein